MFRELDLSGLPPLLRESSASPFFADGALNWNWFIFVMKFPRLVILSGTAVPWVHRSLVSFGFLWAMQACSSAI